MFAGLLAEAAARHDFDKIANIDGFHQDFATGFKQTAWWDEHRRLNRHHLDKADGVPGDVNLIDVIDHIVDCVMAGMARSGSVYELKLPNGVLQAAFQNTVALLKVNVCVEHRETWYCFGCGAVGMQGNFCEQCGAGKHDYVKASTSGS
jgi:hypothetical protein